MNIQVTQKHIDEGVPTACWVCPVALAIREHLRQNVDVLITSEDVNLAYRFQHAQLKLSPEVTEFIQRFDRLSDEAKPIEFELDIPPHFLKKVTKK